MKNKINFNRLLGKPEKSFLLLGPRGTGKSTWLKQQIDARVTIDLLRSDKFFRYQANPSVLRADLAELKRGDWVIIDEAQRVPELLNEVHSLYENAGLNFAVTASSTRKLKRADANLLAGRLLRLDFLPLCWGEIANPDLLKTCLEYGSLPAALNDSQHAADMLSSYVQTYLREEVAAEALTRSLEPFARFLSCAAQYHGQLLNVESVASQAAIKRGSVDNYFGILEGTLLGFRLPALRLGARAREAAHPKFYFFDAGVARAAAGWIREEVPEAWLGFSFETLVLNELRTYSSYNRLEKNIFHYTVTSSFDIDLVVEVRKKILHQPASYIAIEVKLAKKWHRDWTQTLSSFVEDKKAKVQACYGIYLGEETKTEGKVTVLNFIEFSRRLWAGEIF